MSDEALAPATVASPRPRSLGLELVLVVLVSFAVLAPGISRYSLVDPWETHYGEVARVMLQNHDWVHLDWPGGMDPKDHEGFRSKPVLSFWMMAASMKTLGVAEDGGYSGEMVDSPMTMVAIRLPFIAFAILGLALIWWMLARLVSRRMAWLALLVIGTTPFVSLIARQALPDTPLLGCVMGALACFALAMEDGERPFSHIATLRFGRRRVIIDARHLFLLIVGGFVVVQCVYYVLYFIAAPRLAVRFANPVMFFPLFMGLLLGGLSRHGWLVVRFPFVILGTLISLIVNARRGALAAVDSWERYAPDRFVIRLLAFPIVWSFGGSWRSSADVADRVLGMSPLTTMRQIYLLWCYAFLGISILAKGPPGLAVIGVVGVFYVILLGKWRALFDGKFELKRGILLIIVVFLPWHLGMWLKEGPRFKDEYLYTHILNRAAVGVDNSPGTFGYYTDVIGHGMWLWAGLVPAALAAGILRARTDTREGRVRFIVALWAIGSATFFMIVQTKFHHYILPLIPALGLLVAFFLDDMLARRARLHPLLALTGIGIVLLVTRDLMWHPEHLIELFVFRYDRPWPANDPWAIEPSDAFLVLGLIAAAALAIAALPWRRFGVAALAVASLAICVWGLQVYMPIAGRHWGMREAVRAYYKERTIYGCKTIYYSTRQFADEWAGIRDRWTFETMIPDTLYVGQPMTVRIEVRKASDSNVAEHEMAMIGTVSRIGTHEVEVTLPPAERAKVDALERIGKTAKRRAVPPPTRIVDADRLIAWQLYWRGENFWTADELFGPVPEMRTGFNKTDNVDFTKYVNDRTRAPLGRRYFIITEAARASSMRSLLPTTRAKESFEVVDTTSNKFTLVSFWM
jgi:4-amino-4-deoxy-L-arabinose transferase-like glycosyltransferase